MARLHRCNTVPTANWRCLRPNRPTRKSAPHRPAPPSPRRARERFTNSASQCWMSPPELFVYEFDWLPGANGFVGTAAPGDGDNNWWIAKLYEFEASRPTP